MPGAVEQDKIPSNVQTVGASAFDYAKAPDLLQAMVQALPGVALSSQTGNEFQLDFNYRGYVAGPVIGTPQGLAVYQNGVRINEVFGDVVNWDLIPQSAINRLTLVPSNPVYGLNAIGGALAFEMKNGYTYHAVEGEVNGGSYGRAVASVQAGGEVGNLSGYITADAIDDAGWRNELRHHPCDASMPISAHAATRPNFTSPSRVQTTTSTEPRPLPCKCSPELGRALHAAANDAKSTCFPDRECDLEAERHVDLSGNCLFSQFSSDARRRQPHQRANDPAMCPDPTFSAFPIWTARCPTSPRRGAKQSQQRGPLGFPSFLGELDRTWTTTNSFGGSVQASSAEKLFGHENNFTIGLSVDRGLVQFSTTSELGTVNANQFPMVQGSGLFINQPSGDVAPVGLGATTLYTGLYATDTFDVTSRLSVTAGGRYNFAQINLTDALGNNALLNGNHTYTHFNPMIGATYKVTPNLTLYGDFAEANRAPTPLELACSDPVRPCLIDNALVGDPNLQQVVSYTFEGGLRGQFDIAKGLLNWTVGGFHALNTNDILPISSPLIGHQFFQNAGNTLRQGIEANVTYKQDRWNVYANYTYVDATFRNALTLQSPFNPFADANGNIFVVPGDHIPGIPDFRFKLGGEYQITNPWKFGADLNVIGSQWLVGDQSNQNPKLPAYWVVNLHSSYKITENVEVFGLVRNLFNQHYSVFGTFFDVNSYPYLNLSDPRTFVPGMPFAAYVGVRGTIPTTGPAFAADASPPLVTKTSPIAWTEAASSVVSWTGIYLGLNAGFSFGGSDWTDSVTGGSTGNFSTSGFVFGGTVGANYQVGSLVFGVEADGDWADASGFGTFTASALCAGGCLTQNTWLSTARARVGYALDRFLVYGTGGAAFGNVRANFSNDPVSSTTEAGWTAGAGVEVALARNWSAKAEYLFVKLADGSCTTDCAIADASGTPVIPNVAVKFSESIVRGGINYRFAW